MREKKNLPLLYYLQSIAALNKKEILLIEAASKPINLEKNDWLLKEGQRCNGIYFLLTGMIRTVAEDEEREITAWITLPNRFVTVANSYFHHLPSTVGLQAIARSELLWFSDTDIKRLCRVIPALKDVFLFILHERYSELERLFLFCLARSAQQRYINFYTHFRELFFKVPLKYIASMINIQPETLSRIRRRQQENNLDLPFTG